LRQLPDQCVLAASAADDENLHRGERASATNEKQARWGVSGRTSWLRRASPCQQIFAITPLAGRDAIEPR
jgi:hypothetical protein